MTEPKKLDVIFKGDWVLFENPKSKKCLIGLVLSFPFFEERNWRNIEYTYEYAYIKNNKKNIGVLCSRFVVENCQLLPADVSTHGFITINQYKLTIPKPKFTDEKFYVDAQIYERIKELLH